jgi:hypothetical protein
MRQELYQIWNEKSNFMQRAAAANPFSTEAFFWVDIGIFRNASDMPRFSSWPLPRRVALLPRHQVLLCLFFFNC